MLRLRRISDLLRDSADFIEGQTGNAVTASDVKAKMIRELRDMAREILTSQEYQNAKIKI
jgi:hypothetical protein